MVSYLLAVCNVIPEVTGAICALVEALSVIALVVVRIIKMFADINAARKDDNPDDAGQIKDIVDETLKDLGGIKKDDNKKQ